MPHFYLHADFFSSPKRMDRRHQKKEPNISQLNPMKRKGSPVINGEDLESPMESPRGEKLRKSGDCEDQNIISERDQNSKKDEYISTSFIFVNSEKDLEEKDEISKLKSKIFELEENMKIVEEKYESDKKDLVNKNE